MTAPAPLAVVGLIERFALAPTDLVVEVGSGDGSLLKSLHRLGPRVLGVESERQCVVAAFCNGIDSIWGEFTPAVAASIRQRYGAARVVIVPANPTSEILAAAYSCTAPGGTVLAGNLDERPLERRHAA